MQLGLVSTDLMLVARLSGVGPWLGLELSPVGSAEGALAWERGEIAVVALDLRALGPGVVEFVGQWQAANAAPPLVAFGPHVHEDLLDAARQAGCAAAVTRGQFARDAERILRVATRGPS